MVVNSGNSPERYAKRVLQPLQATLNHVRDARIERPGDLMQRAAKNLTDAFQGPTEGIHTACSFGVLGLLAQHTSYFNGFAVVYTIPRAVAVAVRGSSEKTVRLVFGTTPGVRPAPREEALWSKLVKGFVEQYLGPDAGVDIAVENTIPPPCLESNLGSLASSLAQALASMPGARVPSDPVQVAVGVVEEVLGAEFSRAFLLAANQPPNTFVVVDTDTCETIALEGPPRDQLGWAIFDAGYGAARDLSFYKQCGERAGEALELLKKGRRNRLDSFRDIAHEELSRILNELPRRFRPIVKHLVNENKRVYSLIGAIRRNDWQLMGSLLFISHASLQTDWKGTGEHVDYVVDQVKGLSSEGLYGASLTGRSGCLLIAGQPLMFSRAIGEIQRAFVGKFDEQPEFWLF